MVALYRHLISQTFNPLNLILCPFFTRRYPNHLHFISQIWHIRPEFEHFLHVDNFYDGPGSTSSATVHRGGRPISKERESKGHGFQQKRKRDEEEDEEEEDDGQKSSRASGSKKGPKKFKRAFGFFVKDKRADAEARIGDASVSSATVHRHSDWRHQGVYSNKS